MYDLKDIETWRVQLGLLPVPLYGTFSSAREFVLLNGARGSFCLYFDRDAAKKETKSDAWSANVGHSVTVIEDDVYIQRWDDPLASGPRRRRLPEVRDDLEGFHRSLELDSPPGEHSIVAHAVRVFRRLRAALGPSVGGTDSLEAFLVLLASAFEGADRQQVPLDRWQLREKARELVLGLDADRWDSLVQEMLTGRKIEGLRADLALTLRHASGMLFQEAHYAAVFDPVEQFLLPGLPPSPVTVASQTAAVGLHFTPPAIVRTLVEEALFAYAEKPESITVFDPACGSGEFLREALRQLTLNGYAGAIRLIGFDLSPASCAMARFILAWESRGHDTSVNVRIESCDSLDPSVQWPTGVDLLLMNPPFQSWRDMPPASRGRVEKALEKLPISRPDLAAAFLWKALHSMAAHGVMGTIMPAPFLDGIAFGTLRDALAERLETRIVARLGSHELFHQAVVDACFYVGRRGEQKGVALAVWASHRSSSSSAALRMLRRLRAIHDTCPEPIDREAEGFSLYLNPEVGTKGESWAPRPYGKWQFDRKVAQVPRVGDQFDVRQGTLTGLNRAFLVTRAEWLRLPEPERPYFRPAVFHESLRDGRIFDEAYVFFPYGAYEIKDERELRNRVPAFYNDYLRPQKADLQARQGIDPNAWWHLTRPREWQAKPVKKLVSAYFGDAGSFAWDATGSVVVVQGYGWLTKTKLRRDTWLAYLAVLNSPVFSMLLAANSNHVSGGQWNLSKRFLEPIALPNFSVGAVGSGIQRMLAALGEKIHAGGLDSLSESERDTLTELAEKSYLYSKGSGLGDGENA